MWPLKHRHKWRSLGMRHGKPNVVDENTTFTPNFWYYRCETQGCGFYMVKGNNAQIEGECNHNMNDSEVLAFLIDKWTPEVKEIEKAEEVEMITTGVGKLAFEQLMREGELSGTIRASFAELSEKNQAAITEAARTQWIWEYIWVDEDRVSGTPCIKDTRMPVSTILSHLSKGESIDTMAWEFDEHNPERYRGFLTTLAAAFDQKGMPKW